MNPSHIIIHHSLTSDGQTVNWQAIRKYHMEVNGWAGIAYQYGLELVNDQYEILKGRMDNKDGAHCIGFNDKSIGVCVVGNFDIEPPNDRQILLLRCLCNSLMDIYGIKVENILGHHETYALRGLPVEKSCPGTKFSMPQFRALL